MTELDPRPPRGLSAWVPLEHDPNIQPLFNISRDAADYIQHTGTIPWRDNRESWLRRVHRRVLTWLAFGRFYVE